jgi:hypothetical protein
MIFPRAKPRWLWLALLVIVLFTAAPLIIALSSIVVEPTLPLW